MTINKKTDGTTLCLEVVGQLDTLTAPELENAVEEGIPNCEKLIIDMAGVDYISSAGIRVILQAHHTVGGENFVLRSLTGNVQEIFRMTGFGKVLNIE